MLISCPNATKFVNQAQVFDIYTTNASILKNKIVPVLNQAISSPYVMWLSGIFVAATETTDKSNTQLWFAGPNKNNIYTKTLTHIICIKNMTADTAYVWYTPLLSMMVIWFLLIATVLTIGYMFFKAINAMNCHVENIPKPVPS